MSPIRRHTRRARDNCFLFESVARAGRARFARPRASVARVTVSRARRSRAGRSLARVDRVRVGHSRDGPFDNSYHLLRDLTKRVPEVDTLQIDTV